MNRRNTQNPSSIRSQLRKRLLAKRLALEKNYVEKASQKIIESVLGEIKKLLATNILVYLDTYNEVETKNLINYLIKEGKRIYLPTYHKTLKTYVFSPFSGWQNLEVGPYGILQPSENSKPGLKLPYKPGLKNIWKNTSKMGSSAPCVVGEDSFEVDIDVAILPGVVFDKQGTRLGYGKGVFDRLLSKSKALRIGLAYDFQITHDEIPKEKHDILMDMIVTEERVIRVQGPRLTVDGK